MFNNQTKYCSIQDVFPFEFIENDYIITKSGKIAAGFRFSSIPDSGSLSEENLDGIHYSIVQSLSALPEGTIFQKIDIFHENIFTSRHEGKGFLGNRWMANFHYRPSLSHTSYLFLIFSLKSLSVSKNAINTRFANRKKHFVNPLEFIDQLKLKAGTAISGCLSTLSMIPALKLERLNNDSLSELAHSFLNLSFQPAEDHGNSKQFLTHAISNLPHAFKIGQQNVSMISMTGQGPVVSSSTKDCFNVNSSILAPVLGELDFPHIVTQSVLICDTQAELRRLDTLRSMLHSFSGQRDQDGEIQESGLQNLSAEIRKNGYELVKTSLQICIFHPDSSILSRQTDKTLTALLSIDGTRACVENYDTANLFFSSLPGNCHENYRWILMPSVNSACYINFQRFFRSDAEGLLLCDRYRQPIYVNFWNDGLDNKNKLIIGPSGSGKSFTVNSFITQHFHDGDQVIIIDVGGSYKALFQVIDGKYIEYSANRPLRFNPFQCEMDEHGKYRPSQEKLNFIISLIAVLSKNRDEPLGKTERAILSHHILSYYLSLDTINTQLPGLASGKPGMDSFFRYLKEFHEKEPPGPYLDLASLLIILSDYTGNGNRSQLLNATEEIDLSDHSLICFDMNGIREDETLFPVISLLIIELVLGKIKKFPERRKHIYMDEAWSMLKETLGEFVMNMFRTIRKSNGAITIITQGITEIEASPVGMAILQNAATKILLDHSSATQFYETLRISLGLTTHEMDLLRSIRKNDAEGWREFFVKFGSEARILMLDAPPEARIAFDSRIQTREKLRVNASLAMGNMELAINEILEERSGHAN